MPINNPELQNIISSNTIDQLLAREDTPVGVADLQAVAAALFEKHNEEVRNDPVRKAEHALQNYDVTYYDATLKKNETVPQAVRAISYNGKVMRFMTSSRGKKPADGFPLYISLHGGGGTLPEFNNAEWFNQLKLWKTTLRLGFFVMPRGITDTSDLHFRPESYVLYDRIIENMIAFEGVDPNRVYLLGFSAGGDGVYQMTAEMSDRFAAANMMAGHPNDVAIKNYRNVPFLIQMGELDNDSNLGRNRLAAVYHQRLNDAAAAEGGYVHETYIHPDGTHNSWIGNSYSKTPQPHPVIADPVEWLNKQDRSTVDKDTDSLLWLRKYKRETNPSRVLWNVKTRARSRTGIISPMDRFWKSDARARQFYWLDLGTDTSKYADVDASFDRASNLITINACGGYLRLLINHTMLDLTKPIHVSAGGNQWLVSPRLSLKSMVQTLLDRGDINYIYPAAIEVTKTASGGYVVQGGVKLSDPAKAVCLNDMTGYLMAQFPDQLGMWNFGTNNTLSGDWLLATPSGALGLPYESFKQAVPGDYPLFGLSSGNATQPNQQSVAIQATVTKPGADAAKLLEGHSYKLYEEMYSLITNAKMFVDITALTPPTGRFLAALTNALTYISNQPEDQRPIIRILYSNWSSGTADSAHYLREAKEFLKEILQGVDPAKKLEVYVGVVNSGPEKGVSAWAASWNHAKIVAADGTSALVGGHEMWSEQYLDKNPVFDVSMKLQGDSAAHAQDYADGLWRYLLWRVNESLFDQQQRDAGLAPLVQTAAYIYDGASRMSSVKAPAQPDSEIYARAKEKFAAPSGSLPVLSLGRNAGSDLSAVFPSRSSYLGEGGEPADQGIYWLLSKAQKNIRMSVQTFNVVPVPSRFERLIATWDYRLFYELAQALKRGVTVNVVLSNPGSIHAGDEAADISQRLSDILVRDCYLAENAAADLIASKLAVGSLRFSADDAYPDTQGAKTIPFPNHAKTFMVDDRVFYVGSQDPFRSHSAAFGYLIEDAAIAQSYIESYWAKLWEQSQRTVKQGARSSLATSQNAEATLFILDLMDNRRLRGTWQSAIADYVDAATDAKAPFIAILNDIIANAGYETSADAVIELTRTPFFTNTRPQNAATDESDRFVKDLFTQKSLLSDFAALIDSIDGDAASSDAAINLFLISRKYNCTVLQIYASFASIRGSNLNYYQGSYAGAVLPDGGKAFDFEARTGLLRQAPEKSGAAAQMQAAPLLVVESAQSIKLNGVPLLKPVYTDSVLTWNTAGGNTTSGSLTFSEVPRSGLLDPFCGVECFGWIEYPDSAAAPFKGRLSFYSRRHSDNNTPVQPTTPVVGPLVWPVVVSVLLGLMLCFAVVGAIFRSRDRWDWRDRENRRNRYTQLIDESGLDAPSEKEYKQNEEHGDVELRRRNVRFDVDSANAQNRDGWASDALEGMLKRDIEHFVNQEGAAVDQHKLQLSFERQFSDLVQPSMVEDDFAQDSSRVVDSILSSDFPSQVWDIITSSFHDQIAQSVRKSLIDLMGADNYKKVAESVAAHLEASIRNRLTDPMARRMNAQSLPSGESYIRSLLSADVISAKADFIKDPSNKAVLQSDLGREISSILSEQKTTETERSSSEAALRNAQGDYERTKTVADEQRVDDIGNKLAALEEKAEKLEEKRREAERRRDELDSDKLEERRKAERKKAEEKRREVFEI